MIQKLAALMIMFGGSTHALAQSDNPPAEPTQTPAEVDAEIESDIANAEVPSGHFSAELGVGLRRGLGPEFRLNWFREDDQVYGLKIGSYTASNVSHFDKLKMMTIGLESRFSLEGSLFVEGGVDITNIKATIDEAEKISTAGSGTYGFDGSVNQMYFELAFGNQWQAGGWTYGADWLNVNIPFSGSGFSTSSTGTIADRESRERRNKRDLKTEAWDIGIGVSVHAGYVF